MNAQEASREAATDHSAEIALVARALDQTGEVLAAVRPDQAGLPTPCASWNVRDLVEHIVDEVHQFAAVTAGGDRGDGRPLTGDGWSAAYREQADALLAAWCAPGAFERTIRFPFGEIPAAMTIGQHVSEMVMHAWDLAKASGQSTKLDTKLGEYTLDWSKNFLTDETRGAEADGMQVGPEIAVGENASLYDRIAAFGGRDPR